MLGSGARCARLRSLTRRPLRLPLLRRRCFGSPAGIRSIVLGGKTEDPLRESCIPDLNDDELTVLLYPNRYPNRYSDSDKMYCGLVVRLGYGCEILTEACIVLKAD